MPQNKFQSSQAGNVFIIILAAVFLFGALMFTFSKSGQKGSGNLTKQQAKIAAQEILSYASLVEGAVDRVRRNGCSENEISFANAVVAGYSNPNSPIDGSCDIFGSKGGKISWTNPPNHSSTEEYVFIGRNTGPAGTQCTTASCTDLMLFLHQVPLNICNTLNQILNNNNLIGNPPKQFDPHTKMKFIGDFSRLEGIEDSAGGTTTELKNLNSACVKESDLSGYFFYHVLLAR